jgi:hypothetical protein
MQRLLFVSVLVLLGFASCKTESKKDVPDFNSIAQRYVKLALTIGQYDADFVDAYYGPDSLKPAKIDSAAAFPKDSLLAAVKSLQQEIQSISDQHKDSDTLQMRATWMQQQLVAFSRRIKIFSGEFASFDDEALELFGVTPPTNSEEHFKAIVQQLDSTLPGKGSIPERVQALEKQFIIPKEKLDTVFKTAIAEAKRRTHLHYKLPQQESFTLEYVTAKPWSGYNWYKGHFTSLIQVNTDLPLQVERAIDLACHEGYPGHHVYNMLMEKNLYVDKGWVEISMYPLFSPQSLIAEGSANYGIDVAFPGNEKIQYAKQVLIPLAGLDSSKADAYFKWLELKGKLNYARNEAARGLINGTIKEPEALRWLTTYALMSPEGAAKSLSFIKKYRSYVINYNYGLDLVKQYIESKGGVSTAPEKRWELFGSLLSNPVTTKQLQK